MDLIGVQGTIITPIKDGSPGSASLRCGGTVETYIAYSDQDIPVGTAVVVYDTRGGQMVDVMPTTTLPERK